MKAVVVNEHGSIDKLVYTDFAEPEISPSEVLVKVNACGINDLDIWAREGISGRWRLCRICKGFCRKHNSDIREIIF